jgi:hypothetical protein
MENITDGTLDNGGDVDCRRNLAGPLESRGVSSLNQNSNANLCNQGYDKDMGTVSLLFVVADCDAGAP